jgi:glyoxylase-like metal-dependent hydrolase (beta-lactamase superfamily II)
MEAASSSSLEMSVDRVDALYEQVRAVAPVVAAPTSTTPSVVAPGIRVLALRTPTLPPAAHTNVYLVGPSGGPVWVVDPGSPYAEEQAVLEAALAELPVEMVLLTHHHGDHVGGAAALAARRGVPIAAHANTAQRLAGRIEIARDLAADEVLSIGGVELRAIYTPGHADGHLCFEVASARATIAGDMVAGIGTILIDPDEGDMAQYLASLDALLARPAGALLPAHGPVIADGHAKLREYAAHRSMREAKVAAALGQAPASLAALCAAAYADTPRALWPLAERSLLAHLMKLAVDGIAASSEAGWALARRT